MGKRKQKQRKKKFVHVDSVISIKVFDGGRKFYELKKAELHKGVQSFIKFYEDTYGNKIFKREKWK